MGTNIPSWYVVFIKRNKQFWWDYIFSRGPYKHVCAIGYDPQDNQWYLYDWSVKGLFLTKLSVAELDMFLLHCETTGSPIFKAPPQHEGYAKLFFPIATCVSAIKHLTKFKSNAFTPTQLFCAYTKAGAKRSFVTSE